MFSAIVKLYGNNVLNKRKTMEEVPAKISAEVKAYVLSENPSFFDEEESPSTDDEDDESCLSNLIDTAHDGDTITLKRDERLTSALVVDKNIVLDLNGHSIFSTETLLKIKSTLVIKGNGNVIAGGGGNFVALHVFDGGKVIINGGTYSVGSNANDEGNSCILVEENGAVEINEGRFSTDLDCNGFYYVLNNSGFITVKGGTFVNYNPTVGDVLGNSFVAEGYESVDNGDGTYTVVKI